ncbi:MinD/ParA family protein [Mycobacterium sp. SMC-13]|uniref:MinD/ParA family ATP-binding protein n=1 Tax=Mycobacterium sp. SMC-13 TaxID=3381626 RepID=UPI003876847B
MNNQFEQQFYGEKPAAIDPIATHGRVPATVGGPAEELEQTQVFPQLPPAPTHPSAPAGAGYPEPASNTLYGHDQMLAGLQMAPEAAAELGLPTAVESVSTVAARGLPKPIPRRGWRRAVYATTRINLGPSRDELYERDLFTRIRSNVVGSYQIGIIGLKGGAGKTSVTVALGSLLADVRGDRILAVDADPDCGNLADRAGLPSEVSVTDLLADNNINSSNALRAYTRTTDANLEVIASDPYSVAKRDFNADDWTGIVERVSPFYNLVLADCGLGLFHSASLGVLSTVSDVVVVATASVDGARQAATTLDWLRLNGYQDLAHRACVVINHVTPGRPGVDMKDLIAQFERHIMPGRVIDLPFDRHIAAGAGIAFDQLSATYRRRIAELAAALSVDFGAGHHR